MPRRNHFRHQSYHSTPPRSPYELLVPDMPPIPGTDDFKHSMREVATRLREANVAAICLVHGTFLGTDALGIVGELERLIPDAGQALRQRIKRAIDAHVEDSGNYTQSFADELSVVINESQEVPIAVYLFHWGSQNHHLGRADGAVRLIDRLLSMELRRGQRVLIWGHSHAGNVFALSTNLLAGHPKIRRLFFRAARSYYRSRQARTVANSAWIKLQGVLAEDGNPLSGIGLDFVTFGTPIRYGWDTNGYDNLLHFIHHHPMGNGEPFLTPFPPSIDNLLHATAGDYVQQMAIAGTNLFPEVLAWRGWLAERRLKRVVQPGIRNRDVLKHLNTGMRVPAEGTTLLVDYARADSQASHLLGHTIYTRQSWMAFHASEVCRRMYC